MENKLDDKMIDYVAVLAKLELSADEVVQAGADMTQMLDYIDKLKELDTEGIEPMTHIFPSQNVFRKDVVSNGNERDALLANAPKQSGGQFQVPKTVE